MLGRRHGGAGIRRGVRSPGGAVLSPVELSTTTGLVASWSAHPDYLAAGDPGKLAGWSSNQGSSHDWVQATASAQPLSGSTAPSGHPSLTLTEDAGWMEVAPDSDFDIGAASALAAYVIKYPTTPTGVYAIGGILGRPGGADEPCFYFQIRSSSDTRIGYDRNTANGYGSHPGDGPPDDQWCVCLFGIDQDTGDALYSVDGVHTRKPETLQADHGTSSATVPPMLGRFGYVWSPVHPTFEVAHVAFWIRASGGFSAGDMDQIYADLSAGYGV